MQATSIMMGHVVVHLVEALSRFNSWGVTGIFHWKNPSGCTM